MSRQALYILILQAISLQVLFAIPSRGQSIEKTIISINLKSATIVEVFSAIENKTNYTFVYHSKLREFDKRFDIEYEIISVAQVLRVVSAQSGIQFKQINNNITANTSKRESKSKKPNIQSQNIGFLKGVVKDAQNNTLTFASIHVDKSNLGTMSGDDGKFYLRLPEGKYKIITSYLGYTDNSMEVNIVKGKTNFIEVEMQENPAILDEVAVYGNLSRGQAKALTQQKNADNVKNVVSYEQFSKYPDRNAAEALQRIPGVALSRDQGEGEQVSVRGMSPRFNAIQVNGQRIPSPDPDNDRAVGLDLLQVDLMESIVINKTLTPDMDGDAIGGTINFNLKQAPEDNILNITAGGGINQQQSNFESWGKDLQSLAVVAGKRFFNDKLGIIAAGSYYRTNRGSLLNQYTYVDNTTEIEEKRNNDYDVKRTRYGLMISPDFRINENHSIKFVANYNVYDDDEIRRKVDYLVGDGEEERETRNRGEYQKHFLYQLVGNHEFKKFKLKYSFNYTKAEEKMPNRTYWRFARDLDYSGFNNEQLFNLSVTDNPGGDIPLVLNRLRFDNNITEDKDLSAKIDVSIPTRIFGIRSKFKTGGKIRFKDRISDQRRSNLTRLDRIENPVLSNGGEFAFEDIRQDDPIVSSLNLGEFSIDEDRGDGEDYTAEENVLATYAMLKLYFSPKFSAVTGLRFERTENIYSGIRADDFSRVNKFTFNNLLPSAQFKYSLKKNQLIRMGYSTGFTRPPFSALIPGPDGIDRDERRIFRKNPEIGPSRANNIDIMFEKYAKNLGLFSVGVFGKFINNQILRERTTEVINDTLFTVTRSVNGETARTIGIEASLVHKFINDGIPLIKWFGINTNYTFTDTEQTIYFEDENEEIATRNVPFRSPKHTFNLGLFYENPNIGLTFTISGVYRSAILKDIGNDEFGDVYFGEQFHLDLSASQQIGKRLSAFIQLNNLTDQDETEHFSDPTESFSRIHQTEGYGFWGSFGIKFEL